MTLTVSLTLASDVEAELRKSIAHSDANRVREVLAAALTPTVEALLQEPTTSSPDDEEWDVLVDQLLDTVAAGAPAGLPILSEYATSRAGIYEEHP